MATLPRMYSPRQRANVSTPFSTSPRNLAEMTLLDGNPDVTSASGISMKQYEEQLNGFKKENFQLKLRIYFLEEKLGNGSPPAVQGLLEHNVRLQVELEELKRQLTDKQQLLAAAAEAIDVLEQQGSMSMDSEDGLMNGNSQLRRKVQHLEEQVENEKLKSDTDTQTAANIDITTSGLASSPNQEELFSLKREHHKALQMIQACMKRIQQQEKQIRKMKSVTEEASSHVSDVQLDKYEEMLRCKDEHIQDLEQRLKDIQTNGYHVADSTNAGNLQDLLTRRLQGLAYFLDKLLSHKCVLGEDKKKLAESLLEQSLALPVGLRLDESMAPEDLTMDESALDISQSLRMEDLTLMFGHHGLCDDNGRISIRKPFDYNRIYRTDPHSESECWSEPDRNVSLARIGLGDVARGPRISSSDEQRHKGRRGRASNVARFDDSKTSMDAPLRDELERLRKYATEKEEIERKLAAELLTAEDRITILTKEKEDLVKALETQRIIAESAEQTIERVKHELQLAGCRCGELEAQLVTASETAERLRNERRELEAMYSETERDLRRAADEAALQASQAALDRTRAHHERMRAERELEEVKVKLAAAEIGAESAVEQLEALQRQVPSEDERPTSPDQGIDSDRLSSLELADPVSLSPRSLYEENATLKQKLARTKATLADTLTQLNAANMRKRSVQRAICREIHKTHGVLRKARDQFTEQN